MMQLKFGDLIIYITLEQILSEEQHFLEKMHEAIENSSSYVGEIFLNNRKATITGCYWISRLLTKDGFNNVTVS